MKTVKIYIETTITGPAAPKRGGYAAALTFTRRNGEIEDRFLKGEEEGTTYNRSVLLAMIYALQKLKEPCRVVFYTRNTYIKNMILAEVSGSRRDPERDQEPIRVRRRRV